MGDRGSAYSREAAGEAGVERVQEKEAQALIFLRHTGKEVAQGGVFCGFWISEAPFSEEADGQASEHAQDPRAIARAHAATILMRGHIQSLV